ncbi:MAG: MarR family transcriptional regulator [Naasia sp.]|nr:MarR family transcriptional regulator [Naasia sp.]
MAPEENPEREEAVAELSAQVGALLAAARSLSKAAAEEFSADLQPAAYQLIRWLSVAGPTHPAAIADGIGMDRSAVSRLLKELRELSLIEMAPDPEDGRSRIVTLTAGTAEKLREVRAHNRGELMRRIRTWSTDDLRQLTGLLARLNRPG